MALRELDVPLNCDSNDDDSDDEFIPESECESSEESSSRLDENDNFRLKIDSKMLPPKSSVPQTKYYNNIGIKRDQKEKNSRIDSYVAKERAESLWLDFLKDTGGLQSTTCNGGVSSFSTKESPAVPIPTKNPEKIQVTEVLDYAGEKVQVIKEVPTGSSQGFSSVLNSVGKKRKLGILEKSMLDWDKFKRDENIQDELELYKRGKDGYLEKLDFLQRTDNRIFEVEKLMRSTRRN